MNPMPQSVIVTGAGGFIGRHVTRCLRRTVPEMHIVALDRSGHNNNLEHDFVSCDLVVKNQEKIAQIILQYGAEAIIHCAGSVGPGSKSFVQDNLLATTLLLETISRIKPGLPFCHIGSSAEYQPLGYPQKTNEATAAEPAGEYGKVKLQTTNAVIRAAVNGDVGGYVLRLFNPIGIGMSGMTLVGRVCKFLQGEQEVHLRVGSLASYRDFIDIRDVAKAIVVSLQHVGDLIGEVVNIGTGTAHHTRDVVNGLIGFCSRAVSVEESHLGSSRSADVDWQEADISKARRLLGWRPDFLFDQTIEYIASSFCLEK